MFYNLDSIGKTAYICTVILKTKSFTLKKTNHLLKTEKWAL